MAKSFCTAAAGNRKRLYFIISSWTKARWDIDLGFEGLLITLTCASQCQCCLQGKIRNSGVLSLSGRHTLTGSLPDFKADLASIWFWLKPRAFPQRRPFHPSSCWLSFLWTGATLPWGIYLDNNSDSTMTWSAPKVVLWKIGEADWELKYKENSMTLTSVCGIQHWKIYIWSFSLGNIFGESNKYSSNRKGVIALISLPRHVIPSSVSLPPWNHCPQPFAVCLLAFLISYRFCNIVFLLRIVFRYNFVRSWILVHFKCWQFIVL